MKTLLEALWIWQREYERVLAKIQELINKEKQRRKDETTRETDAKEAS